MQRIEIWISERGNFSAFPVPADSLAGWTGKLSRFVSFETMRKELKEHFDIGIPDRAGIAFSPTLFGMQKAVVVVGERA